MAQGRTIWLTGLSGSGKSTLAQGLAAQLARADLVLLDGEELRAVLPVDYGHGVEDRRRVLRHIVEACRRHAAAGRSIVVATISHERAMREHAREQLSPLLEVHLDCPAEVCAARDAKGHYARARAGAYDCFVGVTHPYERHAPDLVLDTARLGPAAALDALLPVARAFLDG